MFDFLKIQVFPEVNGTVTMNGQAVKGASVKLVYDYNDKENTIETVTGENGEFHFNEKYIHTVRLILPFETSIHQQITIYYNHNTYIAWRTTKYAHKEDPAISKKLSSLNCELTNEEKRHLINPASPVKHGAYSVARWKN